MEQLKELYYDPAQGFSGADKLYKKAKALKLNLSLKDIKDFLSRQNVAQQHKQVKPEKYYLPFKSPAKNYLLQADLMFMDPALKTLNSGHHIILCVIDIFSRYAWCVALKNKEAETVLAAFKPIVEEAKPTVVQFDGGSEFINQKMKTYCKAQGIKQEFNEPGDHNANGVIERFNGTLRRYLEKYCTAMKTKSWFPVLADIVKNYNTSYHSGLKGIPAEAGEQKVADKIEINRAKQEQKALKHLKTLEVGDQVRVMKNRVTFAKGALPKWSSTVHNIVETEGRIKYKLDNDKWYRVYDLLSIAAAEEAPQMKPVIEEHVAELKHKAKVKRRLNKEGLKDDEKNVRVGLRERKPAVGLVTSKGEKINW